MSEHTSFEGYKDLLLVETLTDRGEATTYLAHDVTGTVYIVKTGVNEATYQTLVRVSELGSSQFPHMLAAEADSSPHTYRALLAYMPGDTFRAKFDVDSNWIMQGSRPTLDEAKTLALRFLEAQVLLVEHGLLYRDVQPGNLLHMPNGDIGILDFEHCEYTDDRTKQWDCGFVEGSWETAPPEELTGDQLIQTEDAAVYRVGALLLFLVVGRMPFKIPDAAPDIQDDLDAVWNRVLATKALKDNLECLEELPRGRAAVLKSLLHPNQAKRTATLAEARQLVESLG